MFFTTLQSLVHVELDVMNKPWRNVKTTEYTRVELARISPPPPSGTHTHTLRTRDLRKRRLSLNTTIMSQSACIVGSFQNIITRSFLDIYTFIGKMRAEVTHSFRAEVTNLFREPGSRALLEPMSRTHLESRGHVLIWRVEVTYSFRQQRSSTHLDSRDHVPI